jgi:hypothetical protein
VVQQDGAATVELSTYLPSVDLPLMARSLGANMSLGVLNANLKSVRAQISGDSLRKAAAQGARPGQGSGAHGLAVAAELQMLGMSSYVNFDMSGEQGAAVSASFVAGQINRVSDGCSHMCLASWLWLGLALNRGFASGSYQMLRRQVQRCCQISCQATCHERSSAHAGQESSRKRLPLPAMPVFCLCRPSCQACCQESLQLCRQHTAL